MDLGHLCHLGLLRSTGTTPLLLTFCEDKAAVLPLDEHFPSSGKLTYAQRIFNLPLRPASIKDLDAMLKWLEGQQAAPPDLVGVGKHGLSIQDVERLRRAAEVCNGDVLQLGTELHDVITTVRTFFAESELGRSVMRGESGWNLNTLESIFMDKAGSKAKVICSPSKYGLLKWKKEYDRRVFLSVDMREANFSALRIMARLVDPALNQMLCSGWIPLLDRVLGARAEAVKAAKPLREIVLGGVERTWLRTLTDLRDVEGVDEKVRGFTGHSLVRRAMGDETGVPEEDAACQKAFKEIRGRFSRAFTEVEHAIIERVAESVFTKLGLQPFSINGDEVVFVLETRSVPEVDAIACTVWHALREVFAEGHRDIQNFFRIESFMVHDLSQVLRTPQHRSLLRATRRFFPSGDVEAFPELKGNYSSGTISDTLRELREVRQLDWDAWLAPRASKME